jgi:chloramphenicol 3-O phosphotransferase
MVRAGAHAIFEDVFLGGAASQQRWQKILDGLNVVWVGVRCDSAVAAGREAARGDRLQGMAVSQAAVVHHGVVSDLEVDTTSTESLVCARTIAARIS